MIQEVMSFPEALSMKERKEMEALAAAQKSFCFSGVYANTTSSTADFSVNVLLAAEGGTTMFGRSSVSKEGIITFDTFDKSGVI